MAGRSSNKLRFSADDLIDTLDCPGPPLAQSGHTEMSAIRPLSVATWTLGRVLINWGGSDQAISFEQVADRAPSRTAGSEANLYSDHCAAISPDCSTFGLCV